MFSNEVKFLLVAMLMASTGDAFNFFCDFYVMELPNAGIVYTCNPIVTHTGSAILENVTGDHLAGYTNDNVECLWTTGQDIPVFPQGIEVFFGNLKVIDFWGDNLQSISAQDLQPFPQLVWMGLSGNNFRSLDGNLFMHNPLLEWINLHLNQIEHIGEDLVTNLNNLETLGLSGNICVSAVAITRQEVIELARQLPILCPPLDNEVTTEQPTELCPCDDEIEELREANQQLRIENQQQKRENH